MAAILTLRLNVNREEAVRCFRPPGMGGWLRDAQYGPLRRIADAYVPFHLYSVDIVNGTRRKTQLLALDAVCGILDLFGFEHEPDESELLRVDTRNAAPAQLAESRSHENVVERVRRILYRTGFFRLHSVRISATLMPLEFHIPYWLGFSGRGDFARLDVLDAVRRRMEGAKARAMFESWLTGELTNHVIVPFPHKFSRGETHYGLC